LTPFEELAEDLLRGVLGPPPLHEHIEDAAVLVNGPPQGMAFAMHGEEDLVQGPFVTRPGAPVTQVVGILLAALAAPLADGFVGHADPTDEHEFLSIIVPERKAEIEPDGVAEALPWEPMMFIEIR
jgi:hypothetical protein